MVQFGIVERPVRQPGQDRFQELGNIMQRSCLQFYRPVDIFVEGTPLQALWQRSEIWAALQPPPRPRGVRLVDLTFGRFEKRLRACFVLEIPRPLRWLG